MIYRATRILLEIVGIAIGGVLVLAALLVWRLSAGPFEGAFIRPYIEQEINRAGLGVVVHLTDARIQWHRFRPLLDLSFSGVTITGRKGEDIGGLQDGTLAFSAPDLLLGRPNLIEIDIRRPEITVVRDASDRFTLSIGAPAAAADGPGNFDAVLTRLLGPPNDQDALGQLRRVRVFGGRVTIDDRKLGTTWSAPDVALDLSRAETQSRAQIDMIVALPGRSARLLGEARFSRPEDRVYLSLTVAGLDVAAVAPLADVLRPLSALAVPVSGDIHATLTGAGKLLAGDASLRGGQGQLVLPEYYASPPTLGSLALDVQVTDAGNRLILDKVAFDLGGARFSASGKANLVGKEFASEIDAEIADAPLGRFDEIWPRGFAVGGRDWVIQHIPAGLIRTGRVHLAASAPVDDPASIQLKSVHGAFDYTGLEVHYFPALPPVREIAGHGNFDGAHMDLTIDSGALRDIAVSQGTVALTGFDREDRAIDINLSLDGPLSTALAVLDMKPLGYAHDLGIVPADVAGAMDMRAHFDFPLVKTLEFRQVRIGAAGELRGVGVSGAVGKRNVTGGMLTIAVDKSGMRLTGGADLAGVPMSLDWRESFRPSDPVRTRIALETKLDDADRSALGLSLGDAVTLRGPIDVTGNVAIGRDRNIALDAHADIGQAALAADAFGLAKKAGEPGQADLSVEFAGDVLKRLSSLRIDSKDLSLAGSAEFGPLGEFRHAQLQHLVTARDNVSVVADGRPDGGYAIALRGARFDAAPLLARKSEGGAPTHMPRIDLTLAVDHVTTSGQAGLDKVSGTATLAGGRLDRASVEAAAGGPVRLSYQPEGRSIALHLEAEDAGALLAAAGLTRGVRGGSLRLDGVTATGEGPWVTTAMLDMKNFRLIKAPIIARLVNAISLTGFVDLLSGQGLEFDRLTAELGYADGKVSLRRGRSAGALAISFEGDVDLDRDRIDLKGTVVPADTFNKIVSAIPVVGMLTGGDRGGLIGWTYTVAGAPNDPRVSVNPLSMFAPGFLRNLFFLGPREAEPKPAASSQPAGSQQAGAAPAAPTTE